MILIHMLEQEKEHFEYFEKIRQINNVSPTIMLPIWKIGGYALGYITAKLGENYMMACTEAVETVIDEHYQNQLPFLDDLPTMKNKIIKFFKNNLYTKKVQIIR